MTDGIIQQVFNAHKEIREKQFVPTTHFGLDYLFEQLQTELIENIKKEADFNHYRFRTNTPIGISLRKLIGDNQE